MKAVVFHDVGAIEARGNVRVPDIAEGEVLVRVASCGICGSDLHIYRSRTASSEDMYAGTLRVDPDGLRIIGHEYAGVIEKVGAGVEGYAIGDRVVGVTAGGGMAELVPVPANPYQLARIPDGLSFEEAATAEPMADSLQMVRKAKIEAGENVVVFGVGIIGLGVIQAIRAVAPQVGEVIAIDVSPSRLEMASSVGASATINPTTQSVIEEASRICGVVPWAFPPMTPPNVAVVIDCAGYIKHMKGPAPLQTALEMLRPIGGRIVCFGAFEDEVTLNLMNIINKQPTIYGSLGYEPQELVLGLELMAKGEVDRQRLITQRFPIEQAQQAFDTQGNGQSVKVMVQPSPSLNI